MTNNCKNREAKKVLGCGELKTLSVFVTNSFVCFVYEYDLGLF